jgi:hypothetical protein
VELVSDPVVAKLPREPLLVLEMIDEDMQWIHDPS